MLSIAPCAAQPLFKSLLDHSLLGDGLHMKMMSLRGVPQALQKQLSSRSQGVKVSTAALLPSLTPRCHHTPDKASAIDLGF